MSATGALFDKHLPFRSLRPCSLARPADVIYRHKPVLLCRSTAYSIGAEDVYLRRLPSEVQGGCQQQSRSQHPSQLSSPDAALRIHASLCTRLVVPRAPGGPVNRKRTIPRDRGNEYHVTATSSLHNLADPDIYSVIYCLTFAVHTVYLLRFVRHHILTFCVSFMS